ncbi:TPA: aminopeptidase, partial [Campylobacter lari]|nr:aminopeptidase [Campylobacter lari]
SSTNDIPISCNFLAYCDGKNDVLDIASKLNMQAYELKDLIEKLKENELIV